MKSKLRRAGALASIFAWMGVALSAADAEEAVLRSLTQRWAGATCVLRIPLRMENGKDEEGWSNSQMYLVALEGEKPFYLRLRVSDLAALQGLMRGSELPAGTVFQAKGWRPDHWGAFHGFDLDLRLRDLPLQARLEFLTGRGFSLKPERLSGIERYLRIEAFQVTFPSEALPARPAAPAPAAVAAPAAGPGPTGGESGFVPALRILAVSVSPPEARPGQEINLVVNYVVEGLPPGAKFAVVEVRELLSGERSLKRLEERLTRAAGTYTAGQRVRIPPDSTPGVYTLRARVRMAGLDAEGSAVFVVR